MLGRNTLIRPALGMLTVLTVACVMGAIVFMAPLQASAEDPPDDPPGRPGSREATATHEAVALTWNDPGDDTITGYQVLRRDTRVDELGQFQILVDDTGSAAASYVDTDVSEVVRYVYRVKARNAAGLSQASKYHQVWTAAAPTDTDSVRTGANELGDVTALFIPIFDKNRITGDDDRIDYYRFTLTDTMRVNVGLRQQDANADMFLEDADGEVLQENREPYRTK